MNIFDLWFCSVKLSNRIKIELMKKFNSIEDIWNYGFDVDKRSLFDYDDKKIKCCLKKAWDKIEFESLLKKTLNQGIETVNFNEDKYPRELKNYDYSPSILFYKGDISKLNEKYNVAIIGSRDCSVYGKNSANLISKELSVNNINIISGMARGIDTCAHKACLETGGYTCAILGSGIDVIYPRENKKIYDMILNIGCIISEFLPGTKPFNYNFPVRNRVISGLSNTIIVVEAGESSGSLITANLAVEQGKEVVALPGSIFSNQSKGTNKLIKDGAYPFTDFEDLFAFLGIKHIGNSEKNISRLEGIKKKISDIISDTPIHIDDIFARTNIDIKRLYELLFELQLENVVICISGNYYVKVGSTV
ncbi:DNA-processing protein DprA [Clostridium magnum]|uniref:Uncharacterized protein n=1 Tax=Clostridium magnum DSM 2767 TaxID=1121326 RepID=A0A162V1M3_9CLOT|nr:DNA-processing protein DprA [Clostridium magnum]KZL94471.1 hypothetical protein CLMAG_15240 [Clostridium magnum DSM 2767]SHI21925.1 DNA processing protein [Clostridium magnum DSM 2767]